MKSKKLLKNPNLPYYLILSGLLIADLSLLTCDIVRQKVFNTKNKENPAMLGENLHSAHRAANTAATAQFALGVIVIGAGTILGLKNGKKSKERE